MIKFGIIAGIFALSASAFAAKKELWVYTSVYKEFAASLEKAYEEVHPEVDVQVFQAGSEKIQAKLEAEILSGKVQADLVMISDPFWGEQASKRGITASRPGKNPLEVNYYSAMVLVAHKDLPKNQRPASFADLVQPQFKKKIQFGSPLESGSAFSTVSVLSEKYGWTYFEKLRDNLFASSGGNSTVIQKVESGEKKIGIVLLENALAAVKRGSPIEIIYPSDGSILIPSVQFVPAGSPNQVEAGKFADFVLSKKGQELLQKGYMYSVRKDVAPPEGGLSFAEITKAAQTLSLESIGPAAEKAKQTKKKYAEIVLE